MAVSAFPSCAAIPHCASPELFPLSRQTLSPLNTNFPLPHFLLELHSSERSSHTGCVFQLLSTTCHVPGFIHLVRISLNFQDGAPFCSSLRRLGLFPPLNAIPVRFLHFLLPQISLVLCDLITKLRQRPSPPPPTPGEDGGPSHVFWVVEGVPPNFPDSGAPTLC